MSKAIGTTEYKGKLARCPFCGGKPMAMISGDGFMSIGCARCNPVFGVMLQGTEEAVVKKWNKAGKHE